jgi:hypothetical protein
MGRHEEAGWERLGRASVGLGSPWSPLDSSAMLPRGLLFPCTVIQVGAMTQRGLSRSRRLGGTWRGCDARCGSRCGRGRSSMIAELLSRCSRTLRISGAPAVTDRHIPGLQSIPRWSRPGKPRRRLSAWCSLAWQVDMSRALWFMACDKGSQQCASWGVVTSKCLRLSVSYAQGLVWWFAPAYDVQSHRRCHLAIIGQTSWLVWLKCMRR